MKLTKHQVERSVELPWDVTIPVNEQKIFLKIIDQGNKIRFERFDQAGNPKPNEWFALSRERFYSALVSLFPDEIAIAGADDEDADDED